MASVSSQPPAVAFLDSNLNGSASANQSGADTLWFNLTGQFTDSVGEPQLSNGRFSGTFSYRPEVLDPVSFLPDFGRYELSSWSFRFFNSHDHLIGAMASGDANQITSTFLNRQVIVVVRSSCIFLRVDASLESRWEQPDWTLRLLFALPNDEMVLPTDLTDARFVSGETRPIRVDANMPVPTNERVAIANATIRRQVWSEHLINPPEALTIGSRTDLEQTSVSKIRKELSKQAEKTCKRIP